MKNRVQLALFACFLSIVVHGYLTLHYYPLKLGLAGADAICNINQTFNCDAASASSFSAVFGIPLSIWGLMTNLILFFLILIGWLEWCEKPERWRRAAVGVAGLSVGASIVMAFVAFTQLRNYCLFCIAAYILSGVQLAALFGFLRESFWRNVKDDALSAWSDSRSLIGLLLAIPLGSWLLHTIFMQNFGAENLQRIVDESVLEWKGNAVQDFVVQPTLTEGPAAENARIRLVEFADFRCSHCKHASYTLKAFVKAHPDVRFEFYSFPLDGQCNAAIPQPGPGISCRAALAVLCAKPNNWALHQLLFDHQDEINGLSSGADFDLWLAKQVAPLNLHWDQLQTCMNQPDSLDQIRAQAKQGQLVSVRGTPTIFMNGKQLPGGYMVPILQKAREEALR